MSAHCCAMSFSGGSLLPRRARPTVAGFSPDVPSGFSSGAVREVVRPTADSANSVRLDALGFFRLECLGVHAALPPQNPRLKRPVTRSELLATYHAGRQVNGLPSISPLTRPLPSRGEEEEGGPVSMVTRVVLRCPCRGGCGRGGLVGRLRRRGPRGGRSGCGFRRRGRPCGPAR